jgi:hypothetical protein
MRRMQPLVWALIGGLSGALLAGTGKIRSSDPLLSVTLGPLGDAVVVAIIWTTIGAVVGTIVAARPLDQSSVRGVLWDVGRSVVVALLWGLVTISVWGFAALLVALLFPPFPSSTAVFTVNLLACTCAVGAMAYGALLWAIVMLLRWTVGGQSRPPS